MEERKCDVATKVEVAQTHSEIFALGRLPTFSTTASLFAASDISSSGFKIQDSYQTAYNKLHIQQKSWQTGRLPPNIATMIVTNTPQLESHHWLRHHRPLLCRFMVPFAKGRKPNVRSPTPTTVRDVYSSY